MAPTKRKTNGEAKPNPVTASLRVTRSMVRRTRSSVQRDGANSAVSASNLVKLDSPAKNAKRKTATGAGKRKKKEKKEEKAADGEDTEEKAIEDGVAAEDSKKKTIVIEHCKQCNAFKTRAIQVKEGLEGSVPGVMVILNPEKPRRGCFEIREEGGKAFISLLGMKRPFAPMKELDMEEVIADIIKEIE
ncbi:PREDICTED: selenoprotein H-like [Tarenaya hassleriana]|uniref:selenoprotein H-like n=1 Tax=Tarenaya hassleriana TaxID=28532 RepID=UPI00053CA4B0|nr:PREDICTED: selenoprotein H-like [Tarenaya hassleriana]XP_010525870.1 PREDICTED: selenoprotein H-like [Tarenaya hassleriana]XP_010525871.1 PREDICTED: selenoprotein H-like [Tarenaya hassleriana]